MMGTRLTKRFMRQRPWIGVTLILAGVALGSPSCDRADEPPGPNARAVESGAAGSGVGTSNSPTESAPSARAAGSGSSERGGGETSPLHVPASGTFRDTREPREAPNLSGMVQIPAGTARIVCPAFRPDCLFGLHAEESLGAFFIDATEVTVAEYRRCVAAGACTEPLLEHERGASNWALPGRDRHPVNAVTYDQAATYCSWVGKRLPNLYEWERAARGDDERSYPWGDEAPTCALAHIEERRGEPGCGTGTTAEVGSYPAGRSPFGVFDMAGNVAEWTVYPSAPEFFQTLIYGGGFYLDVPWRLYISLPDNMPKTWANLGVGFRCAYAPGD